MERIKRAIEKSKMNNGLSHAHIHTSAHNVAHKPTNTSKEFSYSKTKTVELDSRHLEKNRIVVFDQQDVKSTVFDILRTKVLTKMQQNGWKTLAITSPTQGCGKTVIAANLAFSMARYDDYSVLLADFDLKKPEIAKNLGIETQYSIMDYFAEKVKLEDMLINPKVPRMVILPNNKAYKDSSALMSSKRMKQFVEEVKNRYASRMVIFDLPPLLATDDALAFIPNVDCVLLVVGNGMCSKSDIEESMRLLDPTKLIGTVLNKSDDEWKGYI